MFQWIIIHIGYTSTKKLMHRAHSLQVTRGQGVKANLAKAKATIFVSSSCSQSRGESSRTPSLLICWRFANCCCLHCFNL